MFQPRLLVQRVSKPSALVSLPVRSFHIGRILSAGTETPSSTTGNYAKKDAGARGEPQPSASESSDQHPAKQPDIQEAPSRTTGYGPGKEEVTPEDPTSQKNLPSDKD